MERQLRAFSNGFQEIISGFQFRAALSWIFDWVLNVPLEYFKLFDRFYEESPFITLYIDIFWYDFIAFCSFFRLNLFFFPSCIYSSYICSYWCARDANRHQITYKMSVPKQPFVFYGKIQNSKTVSKRPTVFYGETKNLKLHPNGHSFFD